MGIFRQSFVSVSLALVVMVAAAGCVPLWVGAGVAGIVGGYAVSPDTVEGTTSHAFEDTWNAAKEIMGIMGKISAENQNGSQLVATINGAQVTVVLSSVNVNVTKLSVKSRKSFMPKIDVAQDVYAKIVNRLEK